MNRIIFALLAGLLLIPASVYAQERGPTRDEIIDANFSGPSYLDSYWAASDSASENLTGRAEVEVGPGDGASTLAVVLVNRGPSDISGITGQLSLPGGFKATGKAAGAPAVATFNQIATVGAPFTLFFDVDILDSAKVGEYSAQLQVDYSRVFETGAPRTADLIVPFRVTGEAILTISRSSDDEGGSQIFAGRIEDYTLNVANMGTTPITNVVVTMESPSESLKILGDSKWTIQRIEENSQASLATRVFAANALIGNPASFDVTVEYSSNGRTSTEAFTLGTYVAGEISIRAYEVEVSYIGGEPNIVGNLLNEGNTVALFTTIEIVGGNDLASSLPPAQYLGDLEENSPLPFSIPIEVGSAVGAGTYPVTLKVTYKDNLRQLHTLDVDSQVNFVPEQPADESAGAGAGMNMLVPAGIGAAIAAIIAAVAIARRRKKSALKRKIATASSNGDDIERLLDSQRVEKRHDERK